MFNKKKNKKKGFTLIELLIAVLIIGVLAGIALPMYFSAVEKSRTAEPLNLLGSIAKAQERYRLQSHEYTDDISELDITLKDYSTGNPATGNEFTSEFFDFALGEDGATAARKEGDYILGVNYTTSQLSCTPAEHRICKSLGLEEGAPTAATPLGPTCSTRTQGPQPVQVCEYPEGYTTYSERWCNGSYAYTISTEQSSSSSSNTCVEGEMESGDDYYVSTTKRCATSGPTSTECIPNTYSNATVQKGRPMDDELRALVVYSEYYSRWIETIISCQTDSSDGSCIRYNYMLEVSDAAPGGCDRYCNEIDETGFGCANWSNWYCDN